jgi:hypothetical protein
VYVSSCGLGRTTIGCAARKRLRELQVGSPVELKLGAACAGVCRPAGRCRVAEQLSRRFASRRVRGGWYRLTVAEVLP